MSDILYRTRATAVGGRDGHARSEDGALDVTLSTPREMGGPGKAGATNPEQLFAAGYAACFENAVRFVARQQGINVGQTSVTAEVGIGPRADGPGFGLDIGLAVSLPDLDREQAEALIAAAHQVCPYSNATRGTVGVRLTLA